MCKSLWLLCASVLFAMPSAQAVTVSDLYEVSMPVTTNREAAFGDALRAVILRVSGRRDAVDRLGSALDNPRGYVQRFGFTADNVLQVGFDSLSIDRLLSEAGLPIWGRERPTTVVLLSVESSDGVPLWMDAVAQGPERDTLMKAAKQRGVPLVWPAMDALDRSRAEGVFDSSSAPSLMQIAERYNANAVLLGKARSDGVGGYYVRWILATEDGGAETQGTLEEGVHLAADTFAGIYAASGSSLDSVALEISGIENLNAYAATLNYLENMTVVRNVALEQVAGDTLHFRVAVRGDAAQLKRALALDSKLVPLMSGGAPGSSAQRLQFRYRP